MLNFILKIQFYRVKRNHAIRRIIFSRQNVLSPQLQQVAVRYKVRYPFGARHYFARSAFFGEITANPIPEPSPSPGSAHWVRVLPRRPARSAPRRSEITKINSGCGAADSTGRGAAPPRGLLGGIGAPLEGLLEGLEGPARALYRPGAPELPPKLPPTHWSRRWSPRSCRHCRHQRISHRDCWRPLREAGQAPLATVALASAASARAEQRGRRGAAAPPIDDFGSGGGLSSRGRCALEWLRPSVDGNGRGGRDMDTPCLLFQRRGQRPESAGKWTVP